jgi:FkbM family methyltransferase
VGENGKVYAFEAEPDTCALLELNVAENQLNNVVVRNECVMDSEGDVTFYVNKDSAKSSLLQSRDTDVEKIASIHGDRLDKLLPACSVKDRYTKD